MSVLPSNISVQPALSEDGSIQIGVADKVTGVIIRNAGGVAILVDSNFSIAPNSYHPFVVHPAGYLSDDLTISFDDTNTLGLNTSTTKRCEYYFTKIS